MSLSVAYVMFIQASWTVLLGVLVATVLAMVVGVLFLAGLAAIFRSWRWRA